MHWSQRFLKVAFYWSNNVWTFGYQVVKDSNLTKSVFAANFSSSWILSCFCISALSCLSSSSCNQILKISFFAFSLAVPIMKIDLTHKNLKLKIPHGNLKFGKFSMEFASAFLKFAWNGCEEHLVDKISQFPMQIYFPLNYKFMWK